MRDHVIVVLSFDGVQDNPSYAIGPMSYGEAWEGMYPEDENTEGIYKEGEIIEIKPGPMGRIDWIPVTEETPNIQPSAWGPGSSREVNVWVKGGGQTTGRFTNCGWVGHRITKDMVVTHWMPLLLGPEVGK